MSYDCEVATCGSTNPAGASRVFIRAFVLQIKSVALDSASMYRVDDFPSRQRFFAPLAASSDDY